MATAVKGRNGAVEVGTSAVGSVTSWSYNVTNDAIETTAMGDTAKTYLGGIPDGDGTIEAFWYATDTGHDALLSALSAGSTVTLHLYPEGNTSGKTDYNGSVLITSAPVSSSADGIITISFNFKGMLTKGTVA